eukprot:11507453-Ditylum_brightwellii.AAC.1
MERVLPCHLPPLLPVPPPPSFTTLAKEALKLRTQRDPDKWKSRLLSLLGGSDSEAGKDSDED